MAGMEIGRGLNADTALPINVFSNIVIFTKNMYRDTHNKFTLRSLALIKNRSIAHCKNRICTPIRQPWMQSLLVGR